MSVIAPVAPVKLIDYPDSDGQPMADNTKQARWMTVLFGNLSACFRDEADVFIAMNLFWYPVQDHSEIRIAPDVFVVRGRPKGDRGSYKQWEEENIPVTAAIEILSPGNDFFEMDEKLAFYEEYGVQEYYLYDPDTNRLKVFVRRGEVFRRVRPAQDFVSPLLGIRFDLSGPEMVVYYPDGRRFLTFEELEAGRVQAEQRVAQLQQRLARLRELSRKARKQEASPEELQELERLEDEAAG